MAARAKKRAKKQSSRKSVGKKRATKKVPLKKRVVKKSAKKRSRKEKSSTSNQESLWRAYRGLQEKINGAWKKLQADVKRRASAEVLTAHRNHLLLLLGECNYMARECMRSAGESEVNQYSPTPIETDINPFRNS